MLPMDFVTGLPEPEPVDDGTFRDITAQERAEVLADRVMLEIVTRYKVKDFFEDMKQSDKESIDRAVIDQCRLAFEEDRAHQQNVGKSRFSLDLLEIARS